MTTLAEYMALENKISNEEDTYFVVRDTEHPAEDLVRNWSSTVGGVNYEGDFAFDTIEEANEANGEYRFHEAHEGFAIVDYEGLGAFELENEDLEDAKQEADEYSSDNDLALCVGAGSGHFYAEDVLSFHKVREGRYIFEIS